MISVAKLLRSTRAESTWLASPAAPHLWTLELQGFSDPLDADGLWDDTTRDQPEVVEVASGVAHRRLRQALHDHRRRVKKRLDNGKLIEVGQVFTDLVIEVSLKVWNDALRIGAGGLEVLIHNLEQRHREDFADVLPASRAPHHLVVANPDLADDRVRCHFGYGVHVPGADEVPELELGVVSADTGGQAGFAPWVWFRDGRREERPVALYPDQNAQVLCPGWPLTPTPWFSSGVGYILLRRDSMGGWIGFGDDRHTRYAGRQPATREHGPRLRFESQDSVDDPAVVIELQAPVDDQAQPGFGTLAPGAAPLPGFSAFVLSLTGVVLPGLLPGLRGWTLWLDERGYPADGERLPRAAAEFARLDYDGRRLSFRAPGQAADQAGQLDAFPVFLRYGDGGIELDAPIVPDGLPLLRLPEPLRLPLEGEEMVLGRFDPTPGARQAELLLDLLDQPGALHWGGRDRNGTLGAIGLSRRHLRLRLDGDALTLHPESAAPVALFGAAGEPLGGLPAGGARLVVGQCLLVGCYLLRFDRDV